MNHLILHDNNTVSITKGRLVFYYQTILSKSLDDECFFINSCGLLRQV
jgi:putative component of membrane protein insertase Oxa1/YidC/SpoIIIJ protein YidD